ncbi:hypothetical protein ACQKIY_25765 [Bacillus mycoides]|uniref:hypothetical protein n=1 Tax=Bacillus mycoides TaxID=1405 RepID=UPI003CFE2A1D
MAQVNNMNMNVDVTRVIDNLSNKVAELTRDNAVKDAVIFSQQQEIEQLKGNK